MKVTEIVEKFYGVFIIAYISRASSWCALYKNDSINGYGLPTFPFVSAHGSSVAFVTDL